MAKELEKNVALEDLCEDIYKSQQSFFRATLRQLVTLKAYMGRKIFLSPLYRSYGDDLIGMISQGSGISRKVLEDAVHMYRREQLTPGKEVKFVEKFEEQYQSWNEYREKRLIAKIVPSTKLLTAKEDYGPICNRCPILGHCAK